LGLECPQNDPVLKAVPEWWEVVETKRWSLEEVLSHWECVLMDNVGLQSLLSLFLAMK
jgi:hypothetical protein